jgi:glycine C-acetyltransferase
LFLIINKSKTFIYTSALPSILIEYTTRRFGTNREKKRRKLQKNVKQISHGLKNLGFEINSNSHIIPILIGDEKKATKFGNSLMKKRVFAQPIRYPTVAKNKARIRLSVTAWLSENQINDALDAFAQVGRKFQMF